MIMFILALSIPTLVLAEPTEGDLNNAKSQITQYQNEQGEIQSKLDDLNSQIQKIDTEATELILQQENVQAQIQSKELEIKDTEKELENARIELKNSEEKFNNYIRNIYKNGQDPVLEILFSAKDLSDLIDKVEATQIVGKFNQNIINDLKKNKQLVENKSSELHKEQENLVNLKTQLQQSIDNLNESKKNVAALVAQQQELKNSVDDKLEVSEQEYNDILNSLEEQKNKLDSNNSVNNDSSNSNNVNSNTNVNNSDNSNTATNNNASDNGGNTNVSDNSNNSNNSVVSSGNASTIDIVNYALGFQGLPYVWGGTTPNPGFDCSGFMQYVYRHFGYSITRTTYTQINDGIEVSKDNLQAGDLVFFGDYNSPHHVGMYIGNGYYVHAPETGDVIKVSKLSYNKEFSRARRIVH